MKDLHITCIQSDIHWQSPGANMAELEERLWSVDANTDLIVLPEMFNTGFCNELSLAEPMNSRTFRWMKQMASLKGAVVCGSMMIKADKKYYNRFLWIEPSGKYDYYDKKHLFRFTGEDDYFTPGNQVKIFHLKGWRILPQVCYDLRFPAWSRNHYQDNELAYDLAVYVANWPQVRINAWETLLRARAIENWCYVIGVNRTGENGEGVKFNGQSAIIDYKGQPIAELGANETIKEATLNKDGLNKFRQKFPSYLDADSFNLKA